VARVSSPSTPVLLDRKGKTRAVGRITMHSLSDESVCCLRQIHSRLTSQREQSQLVALNYRKACLHRFSQTKL
jgi:hypothetical protein